MVIGVHPCSAKERGHAFQIFGKVKVLLQKGERYFKETAVKFQSVVWMKFGISRGELAA
jgi:hypothetical protein